jgi:type VI secretion system protein ImpG
LPPRWINPAPFVCEGEIYLLGTVLSFFALYASINSFHCLKIINTESQEAWEWQHTGQHALI